MIRRRFPCEANKAGIIGRGQALAYIGDISQCFSCQEFEETFPQPVTNRCLWNGEKARLKRTGDYFTIDVAQMRRFLLRTLWPDEAKSGQSVVRLRGRFGKGEEDDVDHLAGNFPKSAWAKMGQSLDGGFPKDSLEAFGFLQLFLIEGTQVGERPEEHPGLLRHHRHPSRLRPGQLQTAENESGVEVTFPGWEMGLHIAFHDGPHVLGTHVGRIRGHHVIATGEKIEKGQAFFRRFAEKTRREIRRSELLSEMGAQPVQQAGFPFFIGLDSQRQRRLFRLFHFRKERLLLGRSGLFLVVAGFQEAEFLFHRLFDLEKRTQFIGMPETLEDQLQRSLDGFVFRMFFKKSGKMIRVGADMNIGRRQVDAGRSE